MLAHGQVAGDHREGQLLENLEIERDDVLITTGANPASITAADPARPTIQLDGAHRIAIDGLTISGGSTGVVAANAASLAITNSTVTGHASGTGIVATRSSDVRVGQSFSGALGGIGATGGALETISGNGSTGILVRGGSASIAGNLITGNGTNPADTLRHGVLITGGHADLPGENTISNHPVWGVLVSTGGNALIGDPNYGDPVIRERDHRERHRRQPRRRFKGGVLSYRGTAVSLTNAEISGNSGTGVMAAVNSTLEVTSSTVKTSSGDGIWLNGHAYMRMRNPSVVDGNAGSGIRVAPGTRGPSSSDTPAPLPASPTTRWASTAMTPNPPCGPKTTTSASWPATPPRTAWGAAPASEPVSRPANGARDRQEWRRTSWVGYRSSSERRGSPGRTSA